MSRFFRLLAAASTVILFTAALLPGSASAHETRKAGKYTLVVGFMVEPPIEGEKNGVDFRVTNADTNQPVEGIEKTLKVEIGFKTSTTVMPLRTIFRDPGHYTADLIPTAPGQYAFRFTGAIEGLQIDERFQSGPGTFGDVASSVDLQFPDKLPALREIAGVLPATQQAATGA
ncbi:MAG: hypothetical protein Q7O66_18900, partial [Dehalococcoidia bacterium]|nr:hypothetical protein [Dehalococcoidia bacterium]